MKVTHVDHIGINVIDLETVKSFFVDLGFTVQGEMEVKGEWVGRIIGLTDVHDNIAMLQSPDGQMNIELVQFHHPLDENGIQPAVANRLGISHFCFQVDDVEGIVEKLKQKGIGLMGELLTYENVWKLCYVRGPEGIIVELAQKLNH